MVIYTLVKQIGDYASEVANFADRNKAVEEYQKVCEQIRERGTVNKRASDEYTSLDTWGMCFNREYRGNVQTNEAKTPYKFRVMLTARLVRYN